MIVYPILCQDFFEINYGFKKTLLTTSCTDALEMAAILINLKEGDEVELPDGTIKKIEDLCDLTSYHP